MPGLAPFPLWCSATRIKKLHIDIWMPLPTALDLQLGRSAEAAGAARCEGTRHTRSGSSYHGRSRYPRKTITCLFLLSYGLIKHPGYKRLVRFGSPPGRTSVRGVAKRFSGMCCKQTTREKRDAPAKERSHHDPAFAGAKAAGRGTHGKDLHTRNLPPSKHACQPSQSSRDRPSSLHRQVSLSNRQPRLAPSLSQYPRRRVR